MKQKSISTIIAVTVGFLIKSIVVAQELVRPGCLIKDPVIAGNYDENAPAFDDMKKLTEILTTDMRVWGFQVCLDKDQGILAGFRLQVAKEYGVSENYIDLIAAGPESTTL